MTTIPPCPAPLDLLVVAPHPDDAEISCGGTLLAARAQGLRTGVVELTNGEPTPYGSPEIRARETAAATQVLQLDWRHQLELPNRALEANLEARRQLASVFRLTRPKLILAPYQQDAHPDHVAASALVDAARFWSKLSKTDMPGDPYLPPRIVYFCSIHLRIQPPPAFVIDITPHFEHKLAAIRCYASQVLVNRSTEFPTVLDDITAKARYWGMLAYTGYGEPFVSAEQILIKNLHAILP